MLQAGIDDPVGASSVHGLGGVWGNQLIMIFYQLHILIFRISKGVLAVGLFAQDPYPLETTNGRTGLFQGNRQVIVSTTVKIKNIFAGGGWYLLGIQALSCVCLACWGFFVSIAMLWLINKIVTIRMEVHMELMGADLTEHRVKHGNVHKFTNNNNVKHILQIDVSAFVIWFIFYF